jgi:protease-4
MYGEQLHLRRLLDKIHVVPDFQTCGAYKSAGEIFMRSEPSPEAEAMYNWLFDSVFDTYVKMIADGRGQKKETVRGWIDRGLYSAEEAARLGIVDAAEHRHEFLKHIKQKHGDEIELEPKYGKKERDTVDLSNPFTIFKLWAEALQPSKAAEGSAVAIVYVEGPIVPGKPQSSPFGSQGVAYSDPIRRALDKAADDDTVKGVVLRVNSPGGSAVASEIILQATRRVAEKKPFVVSMGDVAGSGGYYVACGADTIVADAATITASIGVVAGKLATNKMWESVGIDWHPIARGRNSGMLASGEVFTSEQKKNLQEWMNEVYEVFKGHVVAARGDRLKKPIDELAGGRVFTGQQALELGLVDQVGTLSDAVRAVAKKAGLKEGQYETRVIPRPKNFMEELFKELAGETDEEAPIRIESMPGWRTQPVWRAASELLSKLQPQRAAALRRALIQLEILQREAVSLMAPEVVIEFDR